MKPLVFAGPCGVLPKEQMFEEAEFLAQFKDDVNLVIRGGAWKGQLYPDKKMVNGHWVDTPKEYTGLGNEGARILTMIQIMFGIPACTEVATQDNVLASWSHDWAQVGARHMGNLPLLRTLRAADKNIVLKRGMGNTIVEWIGAATHLTYRSQNRVVLCERGISTFETTDPRIRWRTDLLAVPQIKADYPGREVIVDVSHSTGRRDLVLPMAKAAMAAGADGIMVEVMKDPNESMTDAAQGIDHDMFKRLIETIV